jgi:hypothetical protein
MQWDTGTYDTYTVIPNSLGSVGLYSLIGINSIEPHTSFAIQPHIIGDRDRDTSFDGLQDLLLNPPCNSMCRSTSWSVCISTNSCKSGRCGCPQAGATSIAQLGRRTLKQRRRIRIIVTPLSQTSVYGGLGQVLPRACFPLLSRVSPRGEAGLRCEPGLTAPLALPSSAPGIAREALLARFFWRVTYIMPDVKSSGFSSQP